MVSISCSKRLYYGVASFTRILPIISKQHAPRRIDSTSKRINNFLHTYFKFSLLISIKSSDHVHVCHRVFCQTYYIIIWIWTLLAKRGLHVKDLSYLSYCIKNNAIIMIIITMIIKIIVRIIVLLFGYLCFFYFFGFISEAATRIALCKKVFLEISQNLQ